MIKLGTRGSPLALAQAKLVADGLSHAAEININSIEIVTFNTSGDILKDQPLTELGGKGLFTKEIDSALHDGHIDVAVHSYKDVATTLPDGIKTVACLKRDDPRDVLLLRAGNQFEDLAHGATIGTASLRRTALLKILRPDLQFGLLRGNVQTRLKKLAEGQCDATVLALAGLNRLSIMPEHTVVLSVEEMIPAPAQGVICLQCRADDEINQLIVARVNDADASLCAHLERLYLSYMDGSCRTPIAAYAEYDRQYIKFHAFVATVDLAFHVKETLSFSRDQAENAIEKLAIKHKNKLSSFE